MRRYIALFLLLLFIITQVSALSNNKYVSYTIKDKVGAVVVTGVRVGNASFYPADTSAGCAASKMITTIVPGKTIQAGDYFTIDLTIYNIGTDNSASDFKSSDVQDPFGQFRGDQNSLISAWQRAPIANFTSITNQNIGKDQLQSYLNYRMDTSQYLAPGNYTVRFVTIAGAGLFDCIYVTVPISNPNNYFQLIPEFYDLVNFNDINFYNAVNDTWNLFEILTLNVSGNGVIPNFDFETGLGCNFYNFYANGVQWGAEAGLNNKGNCIGPDFNAIQKPPLNSIQNYSCPIYNATSNTMFQGPMCPLPGGTPQTASRYECYVSFRNNTLDYFMTTAIYFNFQKYHLGQICPLAGPAIPEYWNFQIEQPDPDALFMVAGLQFNHSINLTNWHRDAGKRNLTKTDNANITYSVYDISGVKLVSNTQEFITNPFLSLNVTGINYDTPWGAGRSYWNLTNSYNIKGYGQ
ncbi:MAG: hypothetical protein AABY04_04370, partial [Candidatus Micrarchaeota archaeon]